MRTFLWLLTAWALACCSIFAAPRLAQAQVGPTTNRAGAAPANTDLAAALTTAEWAGVDRGIERALAWLAANQQPDGSFPTRDQGQPAVTSLCVMAFLSAGHQPGEGRYGATINRAVDFVLTCQQPNGLISFMPPESTHVHQGASHTATYNHAISGLMLCEVYGQVSRERSAKIETVVKLALQFTAKLQIDPVKLDPVDEGGWRYLYHTSRAPSDSDLSVTGWKLMFLRSAKNAQFEVPDKMVSSAVAYVERCFDPDRRGFMYGLLGRDRYISRGMMGVGALSLALAGKHDTEMARASGDYLLQTPFDSYGETTANLDRFHYSAYYCSNAMAQLGGRYWKQVFPPLAKTLLDAQTSDGYWVSETGAEDSAYGPIYPTALSVLTLTPAYQLLPIYQR